MRRHIIGLIFLSAFAPYSFAAISPEKRDTASVALQELIVTDQAIQRQTASTAPLYTTTALRMKQTGVTTVADAVNRMPGVMLKDYGGAGGLKTVSVRGFGAGHTGVIYDGVPLSDAQSGQIDLSRYSTDNLKSLTMVIGDNDDIFIPARLASSVASFSLASIPSPLETRLEAKIKIGEWGYISPFIKAGCPLSEHFTFNVSGSFTHADNDYPFTLRNLETVTRERRNNSRMNAGQAELNTLWRPKAGTSLTTKIYYYDNSRQLPGPVIYYNDINHETLHERNIFAQGNLRHKISDSLSFMGLAKFNFASSKYHDENGKYPGGELNQFYWQREYYASGALLYQPLAELSIDYSADYFFNNLNSNLKTDNHPWRHSILQSLTARWSLRHLTVMARALYSIYLNGASKGDKSAKDVYKLSPSLSLSWNPWSGTPLYLRLSYKNIFRVPTFNESYFDNYGSENLLPESTDQLNAGLTYELPSGGIKGAFTLDCYMNHIKDMIVAVPYNMFVWRIVNLSKVRVLGLDATASVTIPLKKGHSLFVTGNYSLQRAEPRTDKTSSEWGKQVAYIPLHSGHAALAWENPWCNISVNATGVSHRFTTNNNLPETRIAGYVELGATLWREFSFRKFNLELRADLLNLTDKQYCIVARYPMPGRSWQISASFSINN